MEPGVAGADVANVALEVLDVDRLGHVSLFPLFIQETTYFSVLLSREPLFPPFTKSHSGKRTGQGGKPYEGRETHVEADKGHEQTNVDFGQLVAEPVGPIPLLLGSEVSLGAIEGLKEGDDVALVGVLRCGEARLVDAIVDLVVGPLVGLVDLLAEVLWVGVEAAVLFLDEVVKLRIGQPFSRPLLFFEPGQAWVGWERLTSVPSMRRISLLSLLTMRLAFLSYSTGTVKRPW